MSFNMSSSLDLAGQLAKEVAKEQERVILDQLNELISRGLLVVESTQPILVQDPYSAKVTVQQSCKLLLKDQEYIQKLETRVEELEHILKALSDVSEEILDQVKGIT